MACLTDSGHAGLVPQAMKVQDIIINARGIAMPFILRRDASQYKAIGACYLYGAMEDGGLMIGDADFEWMSIH